MCNIQIANVAYFTTGCRHSYWHRPVFCLNHSFQALSLQKAVMTEFSYMLYSTNKYYI